MAARLDEILPAARDGRVDALVVASDEAVWGRFDADSSKLAAAHGSPGRGEEDLLNLAVVLALRQGGRALVMPRSERPGRHLAADALRF